MSDKKEIEQLRLEIRKLEAEIAVMYTAILEAADRGSWRCKHELLRIAKNDAIQHGVSAERATKKAEELSNALQEANREPVELG